MKYITKALVDSIVSDNDYSPEDVQEQFDHHPEGWNCVILDRDMSIDQMTEEQRQEFREELLDYVGYVAPVELSESRDVYVSVTEHDWDDDGNKEYAVHVEAEIAFTGMNTSDHASKVASKLQALLADMELLGHKINVIRA